MLLRGNENTHNHTTKKHTRAKKQPTAGLPWRVHANKKLIRRMAVSLPAAKSCAFSRTTSPTRKLSLAHPSTFPPVLTEKKQQEEHSPLLSLRLRCAAPHLKKKGERRKKTAPSSNLVKRSHSLATSSSSPNSASLCRSDTGMARLSTSTSTALGKVRLWYKHWNVLGTMDVWKRTLRENNT